MHQYSAPVKEGDELKVKIVSIGEKGDGIARQEGFVIIVPEAKADEEVTVRIKRVLKQYAFAEII